MSLVVKVIVYSDVAKGVLVRHVADSAKFKNRVQLRAFGVKQELVGNTLFITFGRLMSKIIKKGGVYNGVDDLKKADFVSSIVKAMSDAGVRDGDWEVVFDE